MHNRQERRLSHEHDIPEVGDQQAPAYQRIIDHISRAIADQGMVPGSPLPSERQLSLDFGVARATVVRAMRELERSGMVERRRGQGTFVAEVIEPVHPGATLVCIVPNLQGAFLTGLIQGIEEVTRQAGHSLVLANSAVNPVLEAELLEKARNTANGVLLWPVDSGANVDLINRITKEGFPLVLLDRTLPGVVADSVVADNYSAGFLLTSALLDMGHERIAFVHGAEILVSSVTERQRGYRDAFRVRGLPFNPRWIGPVPYGPSVSLQRRHDCVARLLAYQPRTTAFIAVNADVLNTLIHDLVHFGIRIPDDATLANIDYLQSGDLLSQITASVHFDSAAIGRQAVHLLLNRQRLRTSLPERQVVIPVELQMASPISIRIGPGSATDHEIETPGGYPIPQPTQDQNLIEATNVVP